MNFFKALLYIHVFCGVLSFTVGMIVLFLKKGNMRHKQFGKIFFYALLVASFVSLPMAVLHANYFLFIVGVFTAYMLLSGRRYIYIKSQKEIKPIDWILTTVMFLFGSAFILFGIKKWLISDAFGTVLIVFGVISFFFVYQDLRNFLKSNLPTSMYLRSHIARMVGGYIAAVSAFLVVNNTFLPSLVGWLLPSALLTPLIIFWIKKYAPITKISHKSKT